MIRVILKHTLDEHEVLLAEDGRQAIALMEWSARPGFDGHLDAVSTVLPRLK